MADETNQGAEEQKGFTGNRYLVDAASKREFSFAYKNGRPVAGTLATYNGEAPQIGETFNAFVDEATYHGENGKNYFTTDVFQFTARADDTKADGIGFGVQTAQVTYRVIKKASQGSIATFGFELTSESKRDLEQEGFDLNQFPQSFETGDLPASAKPPFPPHNPVAKVARAENGDLKKTPRQAFNAPPKPANPKIQDAQLEAALRNFGRDLSEAAANDKLDPVVGRDEETKHVLQILTRRKQSSACVVGEAGTGKTTMFYAVAQALEDDRRRVANGQESQLPGSLQSARIVELNLQSMNAGSQYRGQFEEKLKPITEGLAERGGWLNGKKIILAIDELPSQLTAGASQGGTNAGELMKPFLTTQGISVLGTTTEDEYKEHIEGDKALVSRFEKIRLNSTSEEATLTILKKLWPLTKAHNGIAEDPTDEQWSYLSRMCRRYAPQEFSPRKEEKAMNMAASSAEFNGRDVITKEDWITALAQMSGLSKEFLAQNDKERFLQMRQEIPNKDVLGQPAVDEVLKSVIGARAGLKDPNRPWAAHVLQGPPGTGKTELAKALARHLFGSEDALIKLDMGEYAQEHSVARLIGAPPGYVGFNDAQPALTERVRRQPYCVLLLDEIEKAHPNVFNTLLPLLNDGKMTDNKGNTVLFNNVIVLMTTNAGASNAAALLGGKQNGMSFGKTGVGTAEEVQEKLTKIYSDALKVENGGPFRPEMINRIKMLGGFNTFVPLSEGVISSLAQREVENINKRLTSEDGANLKNVRIELSDDAMAQLKKEGYAPDSGARLLTGVANKKISDAIGIWVMENREEIEAFTAKNGQTKIVINQLDNVGERDAEGKAVNDPVLEKDTAKAGNDNNPKAQQKKTAAPAA